MLQLLNAAYLWLLTPEILFLTPLVGPAPPLMWLSNGGGAGSPLDTSRVSLALTRARLMGARYPYYYLADSNEGRDKEAEITGKIQPDTPTHGDIRQGFVYERAPAHHAQNHRQQCRD